MILELDQNSYFTFISLVHISTEAYRCSLSKGISEAFRFPLCIIEVNEKASVSL